MWVVVLFEEITDKEPDSSRAPLVRSGGFLFDGFGCGLATYQPEHRWSDGHVQEGGGDQSTDDNDGDGMEDFFSGLIPREHEGDQRDARRKRRHHDGDEALQRTADDHLLGEILALVLHEVQVVREQHDVVARRHAADRDEADQGGDADVVELPPSEG